ncbi:MAG: GNAT family N-acetyltransferase [Acidobacteria bacterium]|nr:GNAT family N-acetyltransferase [Acidobacteriota bacterium]
MKVCETERLLLRLLELDDAAFILELLNEPSFLENIGDKGVRNLDDAAQYLLQGPMKSYEQNGFGLWLVALQDVLTPIGICGLIKRDGLDDPDIGYAFLPEFWSKGYAIEAASAVMTYAKETIGLQRIVAITAPDNQASIRVLNKLGLQFEKMIQLPGATAESRLFTPESEQAQHT